MPTAREYIEEAIERSGRDFGIRVPISSLGNQTAVCSVLAMGEPSSNYERQFMTRLSGADPAVRDRQIASFAGSTGTFTHEGASYSADTTATGEYLFISQIHPNIVLRSLQQTVENLRFLDQTEFPTYKGSQYTLRPAEFPWITARSFVTRVFKRNTPVLTRNRYLQKWLTINSSGTLTPPESWTLTGSSATVTRVAQSTSNLRRGAYVARLTRSGANCTLEQTISVLPSGADLGGTSGESLVGETVTAVLVASVGAANRVWAGIYGDGSLLGSGSDFHSGSGEPEELTYSATIPAGTKYVTLKAQLDNGDTSADIHELYLVRGELTDAIRRDDYPEEDLTPRWRDGNPLSFEVANYGFGSQIVVESRRPYPGFDATRLYAGSADGDSHDAPLVPVAVGLLARVFLAYRDVNPDKYGPLAREWAEKAANLAAAHSMENLSATGGVNYPRRQNLPGANRLAR